MERLLRPCDFSQTPSRKQCIGPFWYIKNIMWIRKKCPFFVDKLPNAPLLGRPSTSLLSLWSVGFGAMSKPDFTPLSAPWPKTWTVIFRVLSPCQALRSLLCLGYPILFSSSPGFSPGASASSISFHSHSTSFPSQRGNNLLWSQNCPILSFTRYDSGSW